MDKSTYKYLWGIVFILVFLVILLLNVMTPHIADDYGYMFYFGAGYPRYINSITDLIGSQYNHYNMWGGRVVGHSIAQILLRINPLIASLLNTSVYMAFVTLIYQYIMRNNKRSLSFFVLINLFVWFFIPALGDTILWISGSANYLWCTTIVLLFLYPYCFADKAKPILGFRLLYAILFFFGGIIAGWTNENTGAGVIMIVILLVLRHRNTYNTIPCYYLSGLLGVCIGYVFLIIAPGNFTRATIDLSPFILVKRFIEISATLFSTYGWMLICILVLFITNKPYGKSKNYLLLFDIPIVFTIGGMVSVYIMLASPQFPERSWFSIIIFFLIAIGMLLQRAIKKRPEILNFLTIACIVGVFGFIFSYAIALKDIYTVRKYTDERALIARKAIEEGKDKAYFKPMQLHSRYVHSEDNETNFLLSYFYEIYIEFEK